MDCNSNNNGIPSTNSSTEQFMIAGDESGAINEKEMLYGHTTFQVPQSEPSLGFLDNNLVQHHHHHHHHHHEYMCMHHEEPPTWINPPHANPPLQEFASYPAYRPIDLNTSSALPLPPPPPTVTLPEKFVSHRGPNFSYFTTLSDGPVIAFGSSSSSSIPSATSSGETPVVAPGTCSMISLPVQVENYFKVGN